jgi:uncharacterized protein (TIGR03083 family)
MADIAELHAQALDHTGRVVAGIPADRWQSATPCDGWNVHELLNHLVAGNRWATELAAGGTIAGVGDRLDGDLLGTDPAGAYAPCAVSYGPVPGSVYAGHRFIDVLVHGWDLAVATGQDAELDPALMQACREVIEPQLEAFRGAGAFGAELPATPGATAQDQFLALLGRHG